MSPCPWLLAVPEAAGADADPEGDGVAALPAVGPVAAAAPGVPPESTGGGVGLGRYVFHVIFKMNKWV